MKGGRQPYEPTDIQRRQVSLLAGYGITQDEIANLLKIAPKTLRKAFRYELTTGSTEANIQVAKALFVNATKHNNTNAQIWWTKARMGWRSADERGADPAQAGTTIVIKGGLDQQLQLEQEPKTNGGDHD